MALREGRVGEIMTSGPGVPSVGARVRMSTPTWPTPDSSSVRVRSALTFHVVMSEQDQRAKLGKDTEELKEGKATTM